MAKSAKTIIGIVVGQESLTGKYFIWSNETYVGMDGKIEVGNEKSLNIGDWVSVSFTKQEADNFFPPVKSPTTPRFESANYQLITPKLYSTEQDAKTVRVFLNYHLTAGQTVIKHNFFGEIYNDRLITQDGLWKLAIRRVEPREQRQTVWVLERFDPIDIENMENEKTVIGIVVARAAHKKAYVWCKETPPGSDGLVIYEQDDLPPGTWIQMKFTSQEYSEYFGSSFGPRFNVSKYTVMAPIHETTVRVNEITGGTTIGLKLECHVEGSRVANDLWNPFVGTIINNTKVIEQTGTCLIEIVRATKKQAKDGKDSVWFLHTFSMITPVPQPTQDVQLAPAPVPALRRAPESPSHLDQRPLRDVSASPQNPENAQPSPSYTTRPFSPPVAHPKQKQMAIITKINKNATGEKIYAWLTKDHREAAVFLPVSSEKYELEKGSVVYADFKLGRKGWFCEGHVEKLDQPFYPTRTQSITVDFQICTEEYHYPDNSHQYPRVYHPHFGFVIDNYRKLSQVHMGIKYHMWIRRARVEKEIDNFEWVVVEQITV